MRRFAWSDVVYFLLYASGIYGLVLWPPIAKAVGSLIQPIDGIATVPLVIRCVLAFVAFDSCAYWMHRAAHANSILWFFHRVHHNGSELGPLTTFRFHVVEIVWRMVMQFVPLYILSLEAAIPPAVFFALIAFDMLAHSGIDWSFGPYLVSPAYHAVHHGRDERANFAMFLPVWDLAFGTAVSMRDNIKPI